MAILPSAAGESGGLLVRTLVELRWRRQTPLLRVGEHVLPEALHPLEVAHRPDVSEAHAEDGDEDEDLAEDEEPLALLDEGAVDRSHRVHECDLHLEDHEHQRDQIEARIKVVPGPPDRFLAAFIDHLLFGGGVLRPQEMAADERQQHEADRSDREEENIGEMEGHGVPRWPRGAWLSCSRTRQKSTGSRG